MSIETDFPASAKLTYLNAANVALMPRSASDYVEAWQRDIAENGSLNFDEVAEDLVFDEVRGAFAKLIGAGATDVAVASSASEFVSSIAWAVMPAAGTRIVTTDVVFPSTSYPWARVARHTGAEMHYVAARDDVVDEEELIAAIDDRTSVVSISHVEYSTGQRFNLKRIADAAAHVGAFFMVDASQSLGAVPLDVREVAIDALVTTSYKWLCGPFGVGLAYISPKRQQVLDPGITGWRSHSEIYDLQAKRCVYHNDARRFEFSTMAYGCAGALAKSIEYLQVIGIPDIMNQNLALADQLIKGISGLDIQVVSPMSREARSSIVSCKFPHIESKTVVQELGEKKIFVSPRRDYFRVSPHLYNTSRDIDHLVEELTAIGKANRRAPE
ncbi:aminotransferase class V-fold PLP-dependent enzyme [Mesorhizobium sp. M8A.F.Ca.ET.165.01.1.1]|uniref:aminotransferase class V-fold PLP-dependent enzyme n=1 Tax=Mesorhizobium sp. M8A.F.Ca.ET.165.01.1.1 TaxID=2563960 RepID=UPI001093A5FC|nr:aminotransferase class V-fold PLP-dependent enzyme [Mesorhizobium sp. M8A.F.Ca.ET.165.01.1.1]TGT46337.1 aminotransferase class V-fold PLP-dependent enzyme [Mesorhizobium sp. M8A.F.Ca.ET.165.01.1.1]